MKPVVHSSLGYSRFDFIRSRNCAERTEKESLSKITYVQKCIGGELAEDEQMLLPLRIEKMREGISQMIRFPKRPWILARQMRSFDYMISNIFLGGEDWLINFMNPKGCKSPFCPDFVITLSDTLEGREEQAKKKFQARGIVHLNASIHDSSFQGFKEWLSCIASIERVACEAFVTGKKLLIHCRVGVSRSASTVAWLIARITGFNYDIARGFVELKRPQIQRPLKICPRDWGVQAGHPNLMYCVREHYYEEQKSV